MQTEIEAKWLNIIPEEFRKVLISTGAILVHKERTMIRKVFDYSDMRLEAIGGWVRVRDEGDKVTMSYKQLSDRTVFGTKEVSVTVSDFNDSCTFLESIGLVANSIQETKRESWILEGSEIEIDTWPWIPSFVEIEAESLEKLKDAAGKLGLDYEQALHGSVELAYQAVYDVTEAQIDSWQDINFTTIPDWLSSKKK
jgi:adenylate cyclase class 2